jgi:SAM-dependent methyltransferase
VSEQARPDTATEPTASSELAFTGERFTPECVREIWYEHMHRYALATRLCAGKRVLDAACGEGYGTAMLASVAAGAVGVDVADEAVAHARQRYAGQPGLEFLQADVTQLPFADGHFDMVVSFETLEHLENQAGMLAEFARVLAPGGCLFISSPDKAVYSEEQGSDNPFHVRELYRDEFEQLLAGHFPHYSMLGQRLLFHSAVWSLEANDRALLQQADGEGLASGPGALPPPMYFLALCARQAEHLPALEAGLCLFDDAQQSVYQHYQGEIRRNMAAGGIIAARDKEIAGCQQEIARLRAELAQRPAQALRPWYLRLFGRG